MKVDDGESGAVLEGQLLQKERELQVYRWRGQTGSNALATQEMFMSSCFHEIGLKYHRLRTEHELMKRKLRALEGLEVENSVERSAAVASAETTPIRFRPVSAATTPLR